MGTYKIIEDIDFPKWIPGRKFLKGRYLEYSINFIYYIEVLSNGAVSTVPYATMGHSEDSLFKHLIDEGKLIITNN